MPDPYQHVLPHAVAAVRAASALAAKDIQFHRSIDHKTGLRFAASGQRLLGLANRLLAPNAAAPADAPTLPFGETPAASDGLWKQVLDALDVLFDRADQAMDAAKQPPGGPHGMRLDDAAPVPLSAAVAEKPQVHFREPVDNSDAHPFVPRLAAKPHASRPLAECLVLQTPADAPAHYAQPYAEEIAQSAYPAHVQQHAEVQAPVDWASSAATWVATPAAVAAMVAQLKRARAIAVDVEHHDLRSYYGLTCLVQISDRRHDWLVDTLALRDALQPLNDVFADPRIVKVFHGASMDIVWLQRDLGLYVVSLFDTYHAARALGLPRLSLAYLLETLAHFHTLKKYQLADWRVRPLPPQMVDYARADTHFLLSIYDQLRNRLVAAGRVHDVLDHSRRVAARRFEYVRFRPPGYNAGLFHHDAASPDAFSALHNIPASRLALVRSLFAWRDALARALDESPRYVMPARVLVALCSLDPPVAPRLVAACFAGSGKILRDNADLLTLLVQAGYADMARAADADAPPRPRPGPLLPLATPALAREVAELFDLLADDARAWFPAQRPEPAASVVFLDALRLHAFGVRVPANGSPPVPVETAVLGERRAAVAALAAAPLAPRPPLPAPVAEAHAVGLPSAAGPDQEALPVDTRPQEEVVTLLPKKNRVPRQKTPVPHEAAFDYLALDSKMLAKGDPKTRRKKRSYEPFSKQDTDGPHPYKGRRLAPQGKSTSFTKKK